MENTSMHRKTLSRSFIRWLLLIVAVVFLISLAVSWRLETSQAGNAAIRLLRLNIQDVRQDIYDLSGENLPDLTTQIIRAARNRHVGENGFILVGSETGIIICGPDDMLGDSLETAGLRLSGENVPQEEVFRADVYGEAFFCMYTVAERFDIVAVIPEAEVLRERNLSTALSSAGDVLVFAVLFILVWLLVRSLVVRNMNRVIQSLTKITDGDLDEKVDVRSHAEFSVLSDEINTTVQALKEYTEAEKERMEAELALARNIQQSALPSVFPPYPNRKEFSLFASMRAAREVGGDFYDFYLPEEKKLVFTVADVSGKGIPAAMFMMSCKTLLREYAKRGDAPADVAESANRQLCTDNEAEMFVTVWAGFLETDTGLVRFINAGHNPPVLIREREASFIPMQANLIMGFLEDAFYEEQTLQLQPGDLLFLYTDGVTEALNPEKRQYGQERLLQVLSAGFGAGAEACEAVCETVKRDVDAFAAGTPQFDDMTVLCLYYQGNSQKEKDGKEENL